ncbi:MAG: IS200/IS605 family transposase [Candidatus Omnitrophota bacterium]|jgi:putative transposase
MEYRRQSHAVYHTEYHIVISTKFRRRIIKPGIREYIRLSLKGIERKYPEIRIQEMNSDEDHIHLLARIAPKMSVSHAVNIIKSNTSRKMSKKFKWLEDVYWGCEGIWSIGYFVSTVGINEQVIRKYIEYQGKEDSGQAQLEF